jgi:hypothetical protein
MKTLILWTALLLASASPVLAQSSIDGKWAGVISSPQGEQVITMSLKAEGDTLTGTISNFQGGEVAIVDGTIRGDTVSFHQALDFNGTPFTINYAGQRRANELLLAIEVPGMDEKMEFVVRRAP